MAARAARATTLRRDGWRWTAWTCWVVALFAAPGLVLLWIEPGTFPAAAALLRATPGRCRACRRGAGRARWSRSAASAARPVRRGADRVALGLLADLVGHREREVLVRSGLAVPARAAGDMAPGRAGGVPGQAAASPAAGRGLLLVRAGRRRGRASGGGPGGAPPARAARGRGGLRDGGEPRVYRARAGGCAGTSAPARGRGA